MSLARRSPCAVVVAEDARGVARRRAREHLAEGDDLRDRLAAVLADDVLHHALAAAHGEVDVDIRHRHALGVEEALEEQVVAQRVDVGDPQRVGDDRAGGRATARADGDAVLLRPLDEVPDDQEVGVEAHPVDDAELVLHALDGVGRDRVAVAGAQALLDAGAQVGLLVLALGQEARDELLAERDLDVAALGDLQRGRDRVGPLGEVPRHLLGVLAGRTRWCRRSSSARRASTWSARTAAPCGGGSPRGAGSARRRCRRAGGRARARCGRCPRWPCPARRGRSSGPRSRRSRPRRPSSRSSTWARAVGRVVVDQPLAEAGGQAAGERDDALAVGRELVHVERRLAAVQALEEAGAGELDEVAVALVVLGQQREVVALDLARGAVGVVVDEVDLAAEDRLDAVRSCRPCTARPRRS